MNVAVILAGGIGSRLGLSRPKQFYKVAGKTIIEHTVTTFEACDVIDSIVIVSNPHYINEIEETVLRNGWKKVRKILNGGAERYDSSMAAIRAFKGESNVNLIFHDAVRPLVSNTTIKATVEALKKYNAVDVAVPAVDTIISKGEECIETIPDRSKLWRGQTPQAFKLETISEAYRRAFEDPNFKATDDCGVVLKYMPEEPIFVVRGEESNMKLTYKEDLFLLDKLFQLRSMELTGGETNFSQLNEKVLVVFGGSYGIGASIIQIANKYGAKIHSFSRSLNGVDISDKSSVEGALEQVFKSEGRIDMVVNTAALLKKEPLCTMAYSDIQEVIRVNYMGMVNIAISAFPYLKESCGKLLYYTSSSYTRGRAFYSLYSSTKAACVNFVQAIAQEWDSYGIKVNCINPERTKTPMREKNFGQENPETLLSPQVVAEASLKTLLGNFNGQIIDVRIK